MYRQSHKHKSILTNTGLESAQCQSRHKTMAAQPLRQSEQVRTSPSMMPIGPSIIHPRVWISTSMTPYRELSTLIILLSLCQSPASKCANCPDAGTVSYPCREMKYPIIFSACATLSKSILILTWQTINETMAELNLPSSSASGSSQRDPPSLSRDTRVLRTTCQCVKQ